MTRSEDTTVSLDKSTNELNYEYEYEHEDQIIVGTSLPRPFPTGDDFIEPSEKDFPPMPEGRMARKQRPRSSRRGGAVHSALLKSAVLASMESLDDSDNEDNSYGRSRSDSAMSEAISYISEQPPSPRKRARFLEGNDDHDEDDEVPEENVDLLAIKMASDLLGTMSVNQEPEENEAPVRRVSRRTSYDEKVDGDSWRESSESASC